MTTLSQQEYEVLGLASRHQKGMQMVLGTDKVFVELVGDILGEVRNSVQGPHRSKDWGNDKEAGISHHVQPPSWPQVDGYLYNQGRSLHMVYANQRSSLLGHIEVNYCHTSMDSSIADPSMCTGHTHNRILGGNLMDQCPPSCSALVLSARLSSESLAGFCYSCLKSIWDSHYHGASHKPRRPSHWSESEYKWKSLGMAYELLPLPLEISKPSPFFP